MTGAPMSGALVDILTDANTCTCAIDRAGTAGEPTLNEAATNACACVITPATKAGEPVANADAAIMCVCVIGPAIKSG